MTDWQERALKAEATVDLLAEVLDHVSFVVMRQQPKLRTMSITYVAGYARAMDDVRQAILAGQQTAGEKALAIRDSHVAPIITLTDHQDQQEITSE